jgi:hypothetical protein
MRLERLLRDLLSELFGRPKQEPKRKAKPQEAIDASTDRREALREKLVSNPITAWSVAKPGNRPDQNQDAYASEVKDGRIRLTLSDGVTEESFDSRGWAIALSTNFLDRPADLDQKLAEVAGAFAAKVETRVANADKTKAYSWLAKPRSDFGSKATLLSVDVAPGRKKGTFEWRAFGVGDTNLFVVRGNEMIEAWPLKESGDFSRNADVASTKAVFATQWRTDGKGTLEKGDRLYLMTDALAQYVLAKQEAGEPVWSTLDRLDSEAGFAAFVQDARAAGMTPDDTTLQRIVVRGGN